jgi:hypothetical protein
VLVDDTRPIDSRLDNVMRSGGRALLQRPKLSAPLHLEGSIKFETDGARSTGTKRAKLTSDRDEWLEHWWIRATHVNSPSPPPLETLDAHRAFEKPGRPRRSAVESVDR